MTNQTPPDVLAEPRSAQLPDWTPDRVLKLRRRLRLEQKDFAALLGVSAQAISRWEVGKKKVSIRHMWLLDEVAAG